MTDDGVLTDIGDEFSSGRFAGARVGAVRSFISAGRPQTKGCVECVQRTIFEEGWKPAFARHLMARYEGLRRGVSTA
jgi:transposase InsO family protein